MKVTEKQLAARYAGMSDGELLALEPRKLTPEAASLRGAELARRGIVETEAQMEERQKRESAQEATFKKNRTRQLAAAGLAAAALLTEFAAIRLTEIPASVSSVVVVVLCVAAIWVLRRRR